MAAAFTGYSEMIREGAASEEGGDGSSPRRYARQGRYEKTLKGLHDQAGINCLRFVRRPNSLERLATPMKKSVLSCIIALVATGLVVSCAQKKEEASSTSTTAASTSTTKKKSTTAGTTAASTKKKPLGRLAA